MAFERLDAVVSRIWNELDGGWLFDDSRLSPILIRDKVLVERAKLINDMFMSWPGPLPMQYFNECCLEIECKQVCDSPVSSEVAMLPSQIITHRGIRYVGSPDYMKPFSKAQSFAQNDENYLLAPAKKKDPTYIEGQDKLTFFDLPVGTNKILVIALWSDPLACGCKDDQIFIPSEKISELEKMVKLELSGFLLQRKVDKRNNTQADN